MTLQSARFSAFNRAKAAAKHGAEFCGMKLTPQRVNKALSVLQQKKDRPYHTTLNSCNCPDHTRRPEFCCGHMIAKMVEVRASEKLLQDAQSVIVTDDHKVFVDGVQVDIDPTWVMNYCNKHAQGQRYQNMAVAYRM